MFSVYTTAKVIDSFCISDPQNRCDWLRVIGKQTNVYYCGESEWSKEPLDPEENVWLIMSKSGIDFIQADDYLNSIKGDYPERVLDNPDSAFLLDISEEKAKEIQNNYGVICQSTDTLEKECLLSNDPYMFQLDKKQRKGWADMFDNHLMLYPSNAMIIIDRYLFQNKYEDSLIGLENIKSFLLAVLPQIELKCNYEIMVVCQELNRPSNNEGCWTNDGIKAKLDEIASCVGESKGYGVQISLVPVIQSVRTGEHWNTVTKNDAFDITHDRRIMTNYYIIEPSYSVAPFCRDISRSINTIHISFAYSFGLRNCSDPPTESFRLITKYFSSLLDHPSWFVQVGDEKPENRLISRYFESELSP